MSVTIYHNPRCSKSRQTLALLTERGIEPEIVDYLNAPPEAGELKRILGLLAMAPRDLMRKGEAAYADARLADETLGEDDLVAAMIAAPILIERPIVLANGKAALGRPPEKVLEIL
ncbi:MAG: arsenate reductase (glutaredoxin) [Alphaproteobacteria bacterium]